MYIELVLLTLMECIIVCKCLSSSNIVDKLGPSPHVFSSNLLLMIGLEMTKEKMKFYTISDIKIIKINKNTYFCFEHIIQPRIFSQVWQLSPTLQKKNKLDNSSIPCESIKVVVWYKVLYTEYSILESLDHLCNAFLELFNVRGE